MGFLSIVRDLLVGNHSRSDKNELEEPRLEQIQPHAMPEPRDELVQDSISRSASTKKESTPEPVVPETVLETTDIHIGIDFGTSYTKACFYVLDRDERTIVVWKPEWQSRGGPLLPSLLWLDEDDTVSMNPPESGSAREIRYFKMAVAGQLIGKSVLPVKKPRVDPYRLYSAFFIARTLASIEEYVKAKYRTFLRQRTIQLSGSLGIPIAYFDSALNDGFLEILSAARYMQDRITDAEPLSKLDELYSASLKVSRDPRFATVPELYAEASGLFSDYHTPTGSYALFDIGGGTVDGAAVFFSRTDGLPSVNFLTAEVDPLGIEIVANQLVHAGVETTQESARSRLLKPHHQFYPAASGLKLSLQKHTAKVIVPVKKKLPTVWSSAKELPVVVCGGGQSSGWHRAGIRSTYTEFQHEHCNIPRYALQDINPFGGEFSGIPRDQLHRYLIAIGLSIPQGYGPEIRGFPSSNPEVLVTARAERQDLDDRQRELYGD